MSYLMFDFEHGHQSIGSKDKVKELFGLPLLTPQTWSEFQNTIAQIYTSTVVEEDIKLGDLVIKEKRSTIVPKNGLMLDGMILDTFSELQKKFQRTLLDKKGKMMLSQWGILKNKIDTCLEFITRIPGTVICTCHSKSSTGDDGVTTITPLIDGSSKEDISKWFDFVFYTKVVADKSTNKRQYLWVTANSERYFHAKDRTGILPEEIPQDYQIVISAAKEANFSGCKILIIGAPGSGKTKSLETLGGENND